MHVCASTDLHVVRQIERLETKFDELHQRLVSEVTGKGVTVDEFFRTLTMLPVAFRNEYKSTIQQKLPAIKDSGDSVVTGGVFLPLSLLFVFIDCDLLNHMISRFGSPELKSDMVLYIKEMQEFIRVTMVGDLIDHWPDYKVSDLNYSKLKAKFKGDPKMYTLEKLNRFRRKFCSRIRLSEFIFGLISLESAESFFATWIIPTAVTPEWIEAIQQLDEGFFLREHVVLMSVNEKQVYPCDAQAEVRKYRTKLMYK